MAKQIIDLGTTPNRGDGDPLRTAFRKINENFDELYAGNFAAPDQTASNLVPSQDGVYDIGSADRQWADLYVKDFIYLNGTRLEIDANKNLRLDGVTISADSQGSLFADDSTLLVDAVNGTIPGTLTGNWENPGNIFGVTGEGISVLTGNSLLTVNDDVFGFSNNKNGFVAFSLINGGVGISGSGNFAFSGNAFAATTSNNINFTSGNGITLNSIRTEVRGNDLILVGNTVDIQSDGDINIDINLSDSTLRRWRFGEDGDLSFPDNSVQSTAWTGSVSRDGVPIEFLRLPDPETLVFPPTPISTGTKGEVVYAGGYVYICVATNTWVRHAIETTWE